MSEVPTPPYDRFYPSSIQTMDREALRRLQSDRLLEAVARVYERSDYYRD